MKQTFFTIILSTQIYCVESNIKLRQPRLIKMSDNSETKKLLSLLTLCYVANLNTVYDLAKLKIFKIKLCGHKCKCKSTAKYHCKSCKKINSHLCRNYHNISPQAELILRIVYEYMFDIITFNDLMTGKWIHQCSRDVGHHGRILTLLDYVPKPQLQKCKWLRIM
jgi:hypothetical protein